MNRSELIIGMDYYGASTTAAWVEVAGERWRYLGHTEASGRTPRKPLMQRYSDDGQDPIGEPEAMRPQHIAGLWDVCSKVRQSYVDSMQSFRTPREESLDRIRALIKERTGKSISLIPGPTNGLVYIPVDVLVSTFDPHLASADAQ